MSRRAAASPRPAKNCPRWVAIAIDGEARGRDVHLPNRALKPTQSANADEVRCARDAVGSGAHLDWLHPEVQRNSRIACAESGLDIADAEFHGLVGNAVEDLLGLAPRRHEFCAT